MVDANAIPWDHITFFTEAEFVCRATGACDMQMDFVAALDQMRERLGIPFAITSGFRSLQHPIEQKKSAPGPHALGQAADILLSHEYAFALLALGPIFPIITGIGLKQHGPVEERFIHLDCCEATAYRPRPHVWSYE